MPIIQIINEEAEQGWIQYLWSTALVTPTQLDFMLLGLFCQCPIHCLLIQPLHQLCVCEDLTEHSDEGLAQYHLLYSHLPAFLLIQYVSFPQGRQTDSGL